jgi:hypothetical protein
MKGLRETARQLQPCGLFTENVPNPPDCGKKLLKGKFEMPIHDDWALKLVDDEAGAFTPEHNTAIKSTMDIRKLLEAPIDLMILLRSG